MSDIEFCFMIDLMGNIGLPEIILGILVLIIFFGSKKMTEMARSAGEAGRELKKIKKEYEDAKTEVIKPESVKTKTEGGASKDV